MPLSDAELSKMAEQRMLMDMMNEILAACHRESPRMAEEMEAIMAEYKSEVRRACPKQGDIEDIIECIEEEKDIHRDNLSRALDNF